MSSLPLLLPLLLGAAGNVEVEGAGSAVAVVRTLRDLGRPDITPATSIESTLLPRLTLRRDGRTRVELNYTPRLVFPGYLAGAPGEVGSPVDRLSQMHRVELAARTEQGRLRYGAAAGVEGGTLDQLSATLNQIPQQGGAPPGATAGQGGAQQGGAQQGATAGQGGAQQGGAGLTAGTLRKIPYLGWLGRFDMGGRVGRALDLDGELAFTYGGGLDDLARATLPTQGALTLVLRGTQAATPRDQITGIFAASTTKIFTRLFQGDCGAPPCPTEPAVLLRLGGGINHVLGAGFSVSASAGAAGAYSQLVHPAPLTGAGKAEILPAELRAVPWALLGMGFVPRGGQAPSLGLLLGVEPGVDRLTGNVEVAATATLTSGWAFARDWGADAALGYGRREPYLNLATVGRTQQATSVYSVGLGLRRSLGRELSTGVRGLFSYQDSERADLASLRDLAGLLDLTFTPAL